jgi:hypothetical protein
VQLLARAGKQGVHIGALCAGLHQREGEPALRRILGILSFQKKYGVARVEEACAAALELESCNYRFVRRYLEHRSQPPLSLRPLEELADAVADGTRNQYMTAIATAPLLIIDDFGMRKLPLTAAEDLLEIVMRRYERASTLLTSNRPVEDWGKLLGDTAAVSAMLDRLLHHGHVLKCGPKSWRTKSAVAQ